MKLVKKFMPLRKSEARVGLCRGRCELMTKYTEFQHEAGDAAVEGRQRTEKFGEVLYSRDRETPLFRVYSALKLRQ